MKKILSLLALLVVLAGALFFYQNYRRNQQLRSLLPGKTYQAYGFKLVIPPQSGSISGWLHPQLKLEGVTADLSAWGIAEPMVWKEVRAEIRGWNRLWVVVPDQRTVGGGEISRAALELGEGAALRSFEAASIAWNLSWGNLRILQPRIEDLGGMGEVRWRGIHLTSSLAQNCHNDFTLDLDRLSMRVQSKVRDGLRDWKVKTEWNGGVLKTTRQTIELGGGENESSFQSKNLDWATLQNLSGDLLPLIAQFQALLLAPKGEIESSLKVVEAFFSELEKVWQHYQKLEIRPQGQKISWKGLRFFSRDQSSTLAVLPMTAEGTFSESPGRFESRMSADWQGLKYEKRARQWLTIEGVKLTQETVYHASYQDFLRRIFQSRFWKDDLKRDFSKSDPKAFFTFFLSSLVSYPDQWKGEARIAKVVYQDAKVIAEHRDSEISFGAEEKRGDWRLRSRFDWKYPGDLAKNLRDASVDFSLTGEAPWQRILGYAREVSDGRKMSGDFSQVLRSQELGYRFKLALDLGEKQFAIRVENFWRFHFPDLPFEQILQPSSPTTIRNAFADSAIRKAHWLLDIEVDRLSNLQKALDGASPGSSLGMVVLAPYLEMDTAKDSVKIRAELKDQKIIVNGQERTELQEKFLAWLNGLQGLQP